MKGNADEKQVDYRRMYYHMAAAVEDAIRILIDAQQTCEDILLEQDACEDET